MSIYATEINNYFLKIKKARGTLLIFLALLMPMTSNAVIYSGNELFEKLSDIKQNTPMTQVSASLGTGYVSGVVDALNGEAFCIPKSIRIGQIIDIVYLFLRGHPESRSELASALIKSALAKVFPCE